MPETVLCNDDKVEVQNKFTGSGQKDKKNKSWVTQQCAPSAGGLSS